MLHNLPGTHTQTKTAPVQPLKPRPAGAELVSLCASLGLGNALSVEEAARSVRNYLWEQRRVSAYLRAAVIAYEEDAANQPRLFVRPIGHRTERSEGGAKRAPVTRG